YVMRSSTPSSTAGRKGSPDAIEVPPKWSEGTAGLPLTVPDGADRRRGSSASLLDTPVPRLPRGMLRPAAAKPHSRRGTLRAGRPALLAGRSGAGWPSCRGPVGHARARHSRAVRPGGPLWGGPAEQGPRVVADYWAGSALLH